MITPMLLHAHVRFTLHKHIWARSQHAQGLFASSCASNPLKQSVTLHQEYDHGMLQATAAAEAMRSTLSHVETALETRESELHDMWQAVQQQAAGLQSGVQSTAELLQPDAKLLVSLLTWACCRGS